MSKKKIDLYDRAKEIMELAEKGGSHRHFFFMTTFERYTTQLNILKELKREMMEDGYTVTKEYVKGRKNIYTHPAIKEYNNTARSANGTVTTLMRIIKEFEDEDGESSELLEFLKGK